MAKFFKGLDYQGGNYTHTGRPSRTISGGLGAGPTRGAVGSAGGFSVRRTHTESARLPGVSRIGQRGSAFSARFRIQWSDLIFSSGKAPRRPSTRAPATKSAVKLAGRNPVRHLIARYGRVPDEIRVSVRRALKKGGKKLLQIAKSNASWSKSIPLSYKLSTSLSWKKAGVRIWSDRDIAPHARPYEGIRGTDSFWVPLFGDHSRMYNRPTKPSLRPAVRTGGPEVIDEVDQEIADIVKNMGT